MDVPRHTTAVAVAITEARPGDRLAEPVLDAHGNVLVGEGCELTAGMIRSLQTRGVEWVCVARTTVVDPAEHAARQERVRARIVQLFRHATQQGRLNPLMHSVLQYRLGSTS